MTTNELLPQNTIFFYEVLDDLLPPLVQDHTDYERALVELKDNSGYS